MAMDPLWMRLGFGGGAVFQVLYAIGDGLCCLVLLRRLGQYSLLGIALALMVGGEVLAGVALWLGDGERAGNFGAFLATGGRLGNWGYVLYPLLPWLAYMLLGFGCGRLMISGTLQRPVVGFSGGGLVMLALFAVVRGINGYGNMLLYRDDLSLLQWLHVSKYPPSLSFGLLTLGAMGIILALFYKIYGDGMKPVRHADPLLVFGRVPLFFYLLHVHILSGSAMLLGMWKNGGLLDTFLARGTRPCWCHIHRQSTTWSSSTPTPAKKWTTGIGFMISVPLKYPPVGNRNRSDPLCDIVRLRPGNATGQTSRNPSSKKRLESRRSKENFVGF